MRKSSKLLAVLLTLCLLFGAITAIFASATEGEAQDPFNVTKHSANDYLDETTTSYNVKGVSAATYDSTREIKNLSYITLDFDITFTGKPTTSDTGRIRIFNKVSYYDSEGTSTGHNKTGGALYFYWNNGNPGIGGTGGISTNGDLNCVDGVYDHITVVMKPKEKASTTNNLTGYQLTQSVYVNGIQTGYNIAVAPNNEANILGVKAMYNGFSLLDVANSGTVKIANVAVNHYTANDASLAACDAYSDKTPLYNIDGLVYNANYVTKNENQYIELSTGEKFYVPAGAAIGAKITDGATVTVKGLNIKDVDVAEGVDSFTVKCENNGTFELSEASAMNYIKDGDVYTKIGLSYPNNFNELNGTYNLNNDTNNSSLGWANNNGAKSPYIDVTYNNAYARIHYHAGTLKTAFDQIAAGTFDYGSGYMERESEISFRVHKGYNEATELSNKKFMTFDFDFGADAYVYTFQVGEETYYATALTEQDAVAKVNAEWGTTETPILTYAEENKAYTVTRDLALPLTDAEKITFRMQFALSDKEAATALSAFGTSSNDNWYWLANTLCVKKFSDGSWYLSNAAESETAKLSGEAGVFDHITYVFEISQVTGEDDVVTTVLTPHIYVNGQYAFSCANMNGTYTATKGDNLVHNAEYHHFQQFMLMFGKNNKGTSDTTLDTPSYKMYDRYSIAFDNMTVTYYDADDLAKTTLDESMKNKAPIYTLDGVNYNENYVTPNADKYITLDGKNYYVFYAALDKAEGKTVNLHNVKIENYVANLESFTVICDGNSTFTLDAAKCWGYYETAGETGTTYTKVVGPNDLKIGLDLSSGSMDLRFYFPHREGLTMTAASYSSINKYINKPVTVNGVEYITAYWRAPLFNMTGAYETTFTFKYVADDIDITLTTPTIKFGVLSYAAEVAKIFPCGSEEAQLIKAIVDYRVAFNAFIGGSYKASVQNAINEFNAIYEGHGEGCTCLTYEPEDTDSDIKYIEVGDVSDDKSANAITTFIQSGNDFGLKITAAENSTVRLTYSSVNRKGGQLTRTKTSTDGAVIFTDIEAADIDNDITITITTPAAEEGGEATVTPYNFCLANYIAACEAASSSTTLTEEQKAEFAKVLPVVRALANYALAAENYKVYVTE